MTLAEVRERVRRDWRASRGEAINEQFYDKLRKQYTVIIEHAPAADDSSDAEQAAVASRSVALLSRQGPVPGGTP